MIPPRSLSINSVAALTVTIKYFDQLSPESVYRLVGVGVQQESGSVSDNLGFESFFETFKKRRQTQQKRLKQNRSWINS